MGGFIQIVALTLLLPIVALNVLGFVVSVVWLAILGYWGSIGAGLLMLVGGSFLVGFALLPGTFISVPGMVMYQRGGVSRVVGLPLMLVGFVWTYVVISAWALFTSGYFIQSANYGNVWPTLLLCYSVGVAPWAFLASKDRQTGSSHAAVPLFFLSVGLILRLTSIPFGATIFTQALLFFIPMLIAMLIQLVYMVTMAVGEQRHT